MAKPSKSPFSDYGSEGYRFESCRVRHWNERNHRLMIQTGCNENVLSNIDDKDQRRTPFPGSARVLFGFGIANYSAVTQSSRPRGRSRLSSASSVTNSVPVPSHEK
jgi:hypothetical protein